MDLEQQIFVYLACIPVLGIVAQLVASWTRLPAILLLLAFGILLGLVFNPDALIDDVYRQESHANENAENLLAQVPDDSIAGTTEPDEAAVVESATPTSNAGAKILLPIVSFCVAIILFEGGLTLNIRDIRETAGVVVRLVTIAAVVTWLATALSAWLILQLNWRICLLLGAVLVVTGPTVVTPLLRYIRPSGRIGTIAKWEGIVIDPIGAVLAVLVFEQFLSGILYQKTHLGHHPMFSLLLCIVVGLGFAFLFSQLLVLAVRHFWIPDYLHGVTFLAAALGAFALSNFLQHESGLITVTAMGILIANQNRAPVNHIVEFKENLGVFLISCLFILLGSRLNPAAIWDVGWRGLAFLGVLVLLVRPLAILLATVGSSANLKERIFLCFLAPRGIVAAAVVSVFALQISTSAFENEQLDQLAADGRQLVPITFLVILGTVAIYGLGAGPLARRLGLAYENPQGVLFVGADAWVLEIAKTLQKLNLPVAIVDTNYRKISKARVIGFERAVCDSILSDAVRRDVDLTGIGKAMVVTTSDELNLLAVDRLEPRMGRENTFRIAPQKMTDGNRGETSDRAHDRILFSNEWDAIRLSQAFCFPTSGMRSDSARRWPQDGSSNRPSFPTNTRWTISWHITGNTSYC